MMSMFLLSTGSVFNPDINQEMTPATSLVHRCRNALLGDTWTGEVGRPGGSPGLEATGQTGDSLQ